MNPHIVSRFDEIYNSTKKSVLAFITCKCGCTADISDIFQETYMELYNVLSKRGTDYITNDKAFVLKLAKQKLSRYYKLLNRLRNFVSLTVASDDDEEVELSDFELMDDFLMEEFTVNKMLLESVQQFVKSKPETVKKVFYLFYDIGLSIPEIARMLSMRESNVKNHLYRTVKEIRNLLFVKGE